jgi:glycosyltransferase involved in cell wall biosynthesis
VSFPFIAPAGEVVERGPHPTVSVLIPCFDASETVADAVASALDQTLPPHQVIVCDDGSHDSPELVLRRFAGSITLLRKQNGGGASALNHALAVATGDLVAVLDADDVYDPRRIEALTFLASARPDLGIVTTDAWIERGGVRLRRYSETDPFAAEDQVAILETCFPGGWPAIRRGLLVEHGGWNETYAVAYDWECWLRLILSGTRVGMVDEPLMTYRLRVGSLSEDSVRSLRDRMRLLNSVDPNRLSEAERAARRRALRRYAPRLRDAEVAAAVRDGARRDLLRLAVRPATTWRSRCVALRAAIALRRA